MSCVAAIRVWRPPLSAAWLDAPLGSCKPAPEGGWRITISTEGLTRTLLSGVSRSPLGRHENLDSLAHELAHMRHRDHGPGHEKSTAEILGIFLSTEAGESGAGEC